MQNKETVKLLGKKCSLKVTPSTMTERIQGSWRPCTYKTLAFWYESSRFKSRGIVTPSSISIFWLLRWWKVVSLIIAWYIKNIHRFDCQCRWKRFCGTRIRRNGWCLVFNKQLLVPDSRAGFKINLILGDKDMVVESRGSQWCSKQKWSYETLVWPICKRRDRGDQETLLR